MSDKIFLFAFKILVPARFQIVFAIAILVLIFTTPCSFLFLLRSIVLFSIFLVPFIFLILITFLLLLLLPFFQPKYLPHQMHLPKRPLTPQKRRRRLIPILRPLHLLTDRPIRPGESR